MWMFNYLKGVPYLTYKLSLKMINVINTRNKKKIKKIYEKRYKEMLKRKIFFDRTKDSFFNYFPLDSNIIIEQDRLELLARKNRHVLPGFYIKEKKYMINVGDFLEVFFFFRGHFLSFEGLCLSIKRKNLINPDTSLFLRNNVQNVWIDCSISFFYNRIYSLKILDYKRKMYSFTKSKWFFIKKVSELSLNNQKRNTKVIFYLSRNYIKL